MKTIGFILVASTVLAHDRYLLPSHTVLSGDPQAITIVASISNDIFHPDRPLGDAGKGKANPFLRGLFENQDYYIILPDGTKKENKTTWLAFERLSVGDVSLEADGTYRIGQFQPRTPLTTFKKADGSPDRIFGPNPQVPEGATDVKTITFSTRVECLVTLNKPSMASLRATGQGLELTGSTHLNDLFVGEPTEFALTLDGKPLTSEAEVSVLLGGTRHRNDRDAIKLTTVNGKFKVGFPQAGFYLFHVETEKPGEEGSGIAAHYNTLFLTLEVFPE